MLSISVLTSVRLTVAAVVAAVHPHVVHRAQHASVVAGVLQIVMGPYLASTVRVSNRGNSAHSTDKTRRDTVGHELAHVGCGSLTAVEVRPSPLSSTRRIVDVIFSYTNRNTDMTEKFFVRVDVTEEFPFLVTKLSPYFDR